MNSHALTRTRDSAALAALSGRRWVGSEGAEVISAVADRSESGRVKNKNNHPQTGQSSAQCGGQARPRRREVHAWCHRVWRSARHAAGLGGGGAPGGTVRRAAVRKRGSGSTSLY